MAKRFTETIKWTKAWFTDLSPEMKLFWFYICDRCDHAGLIEINEKLMSFELGFNITVDEILITFGDKIIRYDDKLYIASFVKFQYGVLKKGVKAHDSVVKLLQKAGVDEPLVKGWARDLDKDKDKDTTSNYNYINTSINVPKVASNATANFNNRFSPDVDRVSKKLSDNEMPSLTKHSAKILTRFGSYDDFVHWLNDLDSRHYKKYIGNQSGFINFIAGCILNEIGMKRERGN